jgi:hypothetical protein
MFKMNHKTIYELLKEKNDKNVCVSFAYFCAYRAKKHANTNKHSDFAASSAAYASTYAAYTASADAVESAAYAAVSAAAYVNEIKLQRKFLKMFDIKA